jgi:hypothetical protein
VVNSFRPFGVGVMAVMYSVGCTYGYSQLALPGPSKAGTSALPWAQNGARRRRQIWKQSCIPSASLDSAMLAL